MASSLNGQRIGGRYEVEELVGTGGMSSVYRARDTVLERPVALKILHEHFSSDPEYVERFRREARAIARMNHPNIVTVIDRGEFKDRQFIVFEHVDGETLKDVVAREGPLPVPQALALTQQVALALAFAHEHGVVHRDVKPQNVLLDENGTAKVTDFGIARSIDPEDALTETGTLLGSSDYIAPEQASGQRVDARSDQYSLGALLFELLTGEVPYTGDGFMAVAMKHLRDPVPSARARRREVPADVDAIVRRAMAKRPEDRFPSMGALMAAIDAALTDHGGDETRVVSPAAPPAPPPGRPTRPPRRRPRRRRRAGLPLLFALLVLVGGAVAIGLLMRGTGGLGGGSAAKVHVKAIADYDPFGDRTEHPAEVPAATDGNPSTFWTTEGYESFSKPGVGLVLDAGHPMELTELTVISDTPGFTAKIQASNRADGGFVDVSNDETVGARTAFGLAGGKYRYYLIWITDPNGRAHINEVRAG
ncbi:MAG TPA: protein kinase [Gaiellaceae bacterium]|nr:protein kinase [Gaiellaceae bacterium]